MHIPQRYHLQNSPFTTPHVRFANHPGNDEGWMVDIDRLTFTFFSTEPRPSTPPIRSYTSNAMGDDEYEVLLAHNNSPPETIVIEPRNYWDSTGYSNLRSHSV